MSVPLGVLKLPNAWLEECGAFWFPTVSIYGSSILNSSVFASQTQFHGIPINSNQTTGGQARVR